MLFHKNKSIVTISGGTGAVNTPSMRGFIEWLVVTPVSSTNVWSMKFTDIDGDDIYFRTGETGTLSVPLGMPIGIGSLERFTISFTTVSINENISVIFKVREKY